MDAYQATYDAVRSRLSNCDVGHAVERAMQDANLSHYADMASRAAQMAAADASRPHVLMRPTIIRDGDQWCALYGDNIIDGVCGFGESPSAAMWAFDVAWETKIPAEPSPASQALAHAPSMGVGASSNPPEQQEQETGR